MQRVVTLLDVAKAAKVSKTTVANVFNRPDKVRPELRKRIQAVAQEMGYDGPDPKGRLLSSGKANAIGLVPPASGGMSWVFSNSYMRDFMTGVAQVCEERGVGLSLVSGDDDGNGGAIRRAVLDGFILSTVGQMDLIEPALRRRLPFVVMDVDAGPDINSVRSNDREAARQLTRHLTGLGHRRFAVGTGGRDMAPPVVHMPNGSPPALTMAYPVDENRLAGVADALAEVGVSINDVPIVEACGTEEELRLYGTGAGPALLDSAPDATAIVTLSGDHIFAVLAEAHRRGISVPGQLSVAGFDDPPEAALADPPLTVIAQPTFEKGRAAARLLFERGPARQIVLPSELKVRSSTAPPRKALRKSK